MKLTQKNKYHIFFWLAYYLFEINASFVYIHESFKQFSWQKILYLSVISEFTFLFAEIPAAYLVLTIIDGKIKILRNKALRIFAVIIIVTFSVVFFRIISHDLIFPYYYSVPEDTTRFSLAGIFVAMMNIVFAIAIALGFEKFIQQNETQKRLMEISKEKTDTELKLLKTQINPHFLFNTLNNIYGLSLKKSDETPTIILKLAKIMRYNIFDSAKNKVYLQQELENIQDFIDIQKIRHKQVKVEFNLSVDDELQEISPLILLQFVENAFKHGASESRFNSFITINLELKNKVLIYSIENSKEEHPEKESTKIGLKNIKRQLDLLYPKHSLEINDSNNLYSVSLKILFD